MLRTSPALELLLVHPGGPFWKNKDQHAWSIPKGEFSSEDPLEAAIREFHEETGIQPNGPYLPLGSSTQSGKTLYAWAFRGDCSPAEIRSNTFTLEWPPNSGVQREFPEVDRADWFELTTAKEKLHKGQVWLVEAIERIGSD